MENFKKLTKQPLFLPIFCMILVLLINLIKSPAFFSIKIQDGVLFGRLIDILNRGSEIAILAVGQTLVVAVSAGTDISVGSVMSLSACSCCMLLAGYGNNSVNELMVPMGIGMLFGVLMGGVCGAMNGALVSKLKIQPMVATLILFTAARAIGLLLCNNQITYIRYEPYKYLGNFLPGCPIPTPVFVAALVILIVTILLKKTALGLYIQSVGINSRAARISGINSDVICFICYLVCGICAGIAGIVASSRIYSADSNNIGLNYELDAILAVALGGNSLGGGKFNLAGSIIGAYTIQAITTTLLAMGVSTDKAPVFKAIIVIIIVVVQAPAFKAYMAARKAQKAHIKEAA
ncbi:simple sugar transport system permease protein [Pseudobutyrivibrio ruminis]|jgi:simple sugar transport system permease protein|uniref:Simple sugar transport system permease protein n=2 Tax=Pseudobutyrivibrio ruminis TaxID=46206 RepID=A0A1H7LKS8_9FIRM|nr:ABC transporter permease [Pseudobutyrivibrio ruminis]SEK99593.1 simple sugar transport system permease protein [Pseudobutyrivibrio ruminis]SOC12173.1 simple sugar transport system permease protein [Pseudobutyrivibrio ruminis DSM 9787]